MGYMSDFEYDCYLKKRIASNAKHKRTHCGKSGKAAGATLTNKQWKEKCGKMIEFNINKPITWEVFKTLSPISKENYIKNLRDEFGASCTSIAEMFGVQRATLRNILFDDGIVVDFPRKRCSNKNHDKWNAFIIGGNITEEIHKEENNDFIEKHQEITGTSMSNISLRFSGDINLNEVFNSLVLIIGDNKTGDLEINYNLRN